MKMKVIDRILISLYAVLGAIALIVFGVCAVCPVLVEDLGEVTSGLLNDSLGLQICAVLLTVVMLAWSARLIMLAVKPEGSAPRSSAAVQESAGGSVRVSVRAMETLVSRAVEQTDGILERKIRINNHDDSVTVEIDLVVGIETHVPQVTALLQRNVKGVVEEFSGIAVREVIVLVTEIRNDAPPALPAPKDEAAQTVVVVPEAVVHEPVEEAEPEQTEAAPAAESAEEPALEAQADESQEPAEPEETADTEPAAEQEPAEEAEPAAQA